MEVVREELFIDLQLKEKSFEKYIKARSDVERPGWFKFSNRLLEDDEFYDFTAAEICAWAYIMSQSSLQRSSKIRLIWDKVDAFRRKFSRDDLKSAIAKLKALAILKGHVTSTLRPRNVDVPLGEDRIGLELAGGGDEVPPNPSPPAGVPNFGTVLPMLGGNSKRDQVLSKVPVAIQQEWFELYDTKWLKDSLLHAIQNYAKENPVDLVKDWPEKLTRWFKIEKKPKLKTRATSVKREPERPHSSTPIAEILSLNPDLKAARERIKSC